ncbi:MAG: hypothetical protein ACKO0W_08275 [Planctomycetota bacterium]
MASRFLHLPLPALALAALLGGGCVSGPMLAESDVPLPESMRVVRSADIRRSGGTVTGGRYLLSGDVRDAGESLAALVTRFEAQGWTLVRSETGLDLATAELAKGGRTASVRLERRALDPAMSTGMLTLGAAAPAGG